MRRGRGSLSRAPTPLLCVYAPHHSHPSRSECLFASSARAAFKIVFAYPRTYSLYSPVLRSVSSFWLSSRYIATLLIRERISSSDALRSLCPNSIHSPKARISGFSTGHLVVPAIDVGGKPEPFLFSEPATVFIFTCVLFTCVCAPSVLVPRLPRRLRAKWC